MPKNKNTTKSLSTSKLRTKKVADLPKAKKNSPKKPETGFSRSLGLYFLAVIGILCGLLLFNLIVHFTITDTSEASLLPLTSKGLVSGTVQKTTTLDGLRYGYWFSFQYSNNNYVVQRAQKTEGATVGDALYITKELPTYFTDGAEPANTVVATFTYQGTNKAAAVKKLATSDSITKEITFAGVKATQITHPNKTTKEIVFQKTSQTPVYSLTLSTAKEDLAEASIVSGSVVLAK